mmetsp:Transcript_4635/g.7436  ORF Transcript_4635/g.7436 Transcript_4635/m.7436 type:complete len:426 (-) Transcript_4635:70-1347(-)|eukprot:CAMPEP_0175095618 /NCGR_PEP_ID=MMETSP0086_2-20121207/4261_1 /TAXON_ID=136419 /ORGANISM="Unknown Unknown, Strain D1" /LENGTH=425 /DNA_ID=CAMNT_0016368897 /DNA_START=137 /DNA_END=1414 /DNA_ORIENTATION=+
MAVADKHKPVLLLQLASNGFLLASVVVVLIGVFTDNFDLLQAAMAVTVAGAFVLCVVSFVKPRQTTYKSTPSSAEPKAALLCAALIGLGFIGILLSETSNSAFSAFALASAVHVGTFAFTPPSEPEPEAKNAGAEPCPSNFSPENATLYIVFDFDCTLTRRHYYLTNHLTDSYRELYPETDRNYPRQNYPPFRFRIDLPMNRDDQEVQFFFGDRGRLQSLRSMLATIKAKVGSKQPFCAFSDVQFLICTKGSAEEAIDLLRKAELLSFFSRIEDAKVSWTPVPISDGQLWEPKTTASGKPGHFKVNTIRDLVMGDEDDSLLGSGDDESILGSDDGLELDMNRNFVVYVDDNQQYYQQLRQTLGDSVYTLELQGGAKEPERFHIHSGQDGSENFTVDKMQELEEWVLDAALSPSVDSLTQKFTGPL